MIKRLETCVNNPLVLDVSIYHKSIHLSYYAFHSNLSTHHKTYKYFIDNFDEQIDRCDDNIKSLTKINSFFRALNIHFDSTRELVVLCKTPSLTKERGNGRLVNFPLRIKSRDWHWRKAGFRSIVHHAGYPAKYTVDTLVSMESRSSARAK